MEAAIRRLVRDRAGERCEYCRLPQEFSDLRLHIEHVTPRQHGGDDEPENLALACPACNLLKGPNLTGIDPSTGKIARLFHPRRESWEEHFARQGTFIAGKTAIGRTTVHLLALNDPERMRVRDGLFALGQWP